jgi:hypothetical protein
MVTAGETGEWRDDHRFWISGDDYYIVYNFGFDTSSVMVTHTTDSDGPVPSLDEFKRNAQTYIDSWLDTSIGGYKVFLVFVSYLCLSDVCEYNDLTLSKTSGSDIVFLNIVELSGAQGEAYGSYWYFNPGASTVRGKYELVNKSLSVDAFEQVAQVLIDSKLNTIFLGYKVTSIEVAGMYGSESLTLSQESGEDAVFERS